MQAQDYYSQLDAVELSGTRHATADIALAAVDGSCYGGIDDSAGCNSSGPTVAVAEDPLPSLQAATANQALLRRLHADEETVLPALASGTLFDRLPSEVRCWAFWYTTRQCDVM